MSVALRAMALSLTAVLSVPAFAEESATLRQTVEQAVGQHPEVLLRWHRLQAAGEETSGARGGWLPSVDLYAGKGKETADRPDFRTERKYTRSSHGASLTQVLFEGFATVDNVARLSHEERARYFELLATADEIAAEVARAYADVLRYRQLLVLAQENLSTHEAIFKQLEQRAAAGVSRRVDLEQAAGRVALARANVITEQANLNDVSQRFRRLTGQLPAAQLAAFPEIALQDENQIWNADFPKAPALRGALASVGAGRSAVSLAKATRYPTLSLEARTDRGTDLDGVIGDHDNQSIGLSLRYNLFNGGRDEARVSQRVHELDAARDLRDKACRDVRQSVAIALNDVSKLQEQREHLARHEQSTGKVREAYRQQFDLGQRSLLDLLDTENEWFQSRRALANAETDARVARARVLAPLGALLPTLGLNGLSKLAPDLSASEEVEVRGCGESTATVNLR